MTTFIETPLQSNILIFRPTIELYNQVFTECSKSCLGQSACSVGGVPFKKISLAKVSFDTHASMAGPQVPVTAGKYKSEIHLVLARDLIKDHVLKLANHMNIEYTELTCLFANLAHHKCMADKYAMNS